MLNNPTSILEISSRTVHKIIARAALSCSICQWNRATGDIRHIIEVSEGGSNAMSNLVYLYQVFVRVWDKQTPIVLATFVAVLMLYSFVCALRFHF